MARAKKPIATLTEEQFRAVIPRLNWELHWPDEKGMELLPAFMQNAELVAVSGSLTSTAYAQGFGEVVGGADPIRYETAPYTWKGKRGQPDRIEHTGNVYHVLFVRNPEGTIDLFSDSNDAARPPHHFPFHEVNLYYREKPPPWSLRRGFLWCRSFLTYAWRWMLGYRA